MSDQTPPAGWYPAPHADNELRYWDGTRWSEPQVVMPVQMPPLAHPEAAATESRKGSGAVSSATQQLTMGQRNAIGSAKSYIEESGFSRSGLIGQLEYEGFSTDEATFGADNSGADWNEAAAESARSYLEDSFFSRQGLYDQLAYEGFLPSEIEYGLAAVGY